MRTMKLQDAINQVQELSDDMVIFARKPWSPDSDAAIGRLDEDLRVPRWVVDRGLEYFLESTVAREVLDILDAEERALPKCVALLIYYAEHDAYPDWVYANKE